MIPLNPREIRRTLKKLGIDVKELGDVVSVVIETKDSRITIEDPQVVVFVSGGQKVYQVIGSNEKVVSKEASTTGSEAFNEDDIRFVMEQGGVDRLEAINALREAGGDIAKALLIIESRKPK